MVQYQGCVEDVFYFYIAPHSLTPYGVASLLVFSIWCSHHCNFNIDGGPACATCIQTQKDVSKAATVFYFVGNCNAAIGNFPGKVVCLDTPDAYPPQRKVFLMWTYVWRHHSDEFEWFMKVDHDSYLNGEQMNRLVE